MNVQVFASPLGNGHIAISSESEWLLNEALRSFHCDWLESTRSSSYVAGICRGWLKTDPSYEAVVRLGPMVSGLLVHGANRVNLMVASNQRRLLPPPGWQPVKKYVGTSSTISFHAENREEIPPDVPVQLDPLPNLIIPTVLVLSIPLLLGYLIRRNLPSTPADWKLTFLVWINWIELSVLIYWAGAVHPSRLLDMLLLKVPLPGAAGQLAVLAMYLTPLLTSSALYRWALTPLFSSPPGGIPALRRRHLVASLSMQLPVAIAMVGFSSGNYAVTAICPLAAYLVYRGLTLLHWNMRFSKITPLESKDLLQRTTLFAQRSGLKIAQLNTVLPHDPEEMHAFSTRDGQFVFSENLLQQLPPREVNAVIAHELSQRASGRLGFDVTSALFWVFILAAGPGMWFLLNRLPFPQWLAMIPAIPAAFLAMQTWIYQDRTTEDDARAVKLTGDPEGKIAALGRLAQLGRMPAGGRGIIASMLTHPSMEGRVLALAYRYGIPDWRARGILRNPDEAYEKVPRNPAHAAAPGRSRSSNSQEFVPVCSLHHRQVHARRSRTLLFAVPLLGAALLGVLGDVGLHRFGYSNFGLIDWLALPTGIVVLLGLKAAAQVILDTYFVERLKWQLAELVQPEPAAVFAGIHPGTGVRYTDGFPDWDFGFFSMEEGWLVYRGDKTSFAIPRRYIIEVNIVEGPKRWLREHRVEVVFRGGAFTMNAEFANATRNAAVETRNWLCKWVAGPSEADSLFAFPEPPPYLPHLPGVAGTRSEPIQLAVSTLLKIWLVAPIMRYTALSVFVLGFQLVAFSAPVAVMLFLLPSILWPIRQIAEEVPEPQFDSLSSIVNFEESATLPNVSAK